MEHLLDTGLYRLVRGRHGLFLANPRDTFLGRALVEYGEFSELECAMLLQLVPVNGVVIEAGANMGALTVPMAKKLGRNGLLYAFEPQPLIFQQLCANLALNDLVNVVAVNSGCGSAPELIGIARADPSRTNNFGALSLDQITTGQTEVRVRVERLDDVVKPPRLDLIKADVEGMELAVLQGASGLISRFRPLLYLENRGENSGPLITHILGLGYNCWWHLPPYFNPQNFAGNARNIYGNHFSYNMLCVPAERKLTIQGGRPVAGPSDHPNHWGKGG